MNLQDVLYEVEAEMARAIAKFPPFHSAHEGYAIILEELEELKTEVFKKKSERDRIRMKKEAIQVAAMAIRFVVDLDL